MTHTNRGRLTVNIDGKWRLYTNTIPSDAEALGTVTQGEGDTGALVKLTSGLYVQINAGTMRNLDGRKVAAALGTAGRPSEMAGGKKVNTYLDAESVKAHAIPDPAHQHAYIVNARPARRRPAARAEPQPSRPSGAPAR